MSASTCCLVPLLTHWTWCESGLEPVELVYQLQRMKNGVIQHVHAVPFIKLYSCLITLITCYVMLC